MRTENRCWTSDRDQQIVRFLETPNGPIAIGEAEPGLLIDRVGTRHIRRRLSSALGGMRVVLRCRVGNALYIDGDPGLERYAADPVVDALPAVGINLDPVMKAAA